MAKKHNEHNNKLGKPLVLRLYEDQRFIFEEFVKNENKVLVNKGCMPMSSSEYGRMVFQKGLDALELKND